MYQVTFWIKLLLVNNEMSMPQKLLAYFRKYIASQAVSMNILSLHSENRNLHWFKQLIAKQLMLHDVITVIPQNLCISSVLFQKLLLL